MNEPTKTGSVRSWTQRLKKWLGWGEPFVIKIETRRSPDWDGDAKRYCDAMDKGKST